ncbi:MAG: glycyl-radical enzyme activating protein [Anaerolineaceae bacterium]|nr:glycyl-radical enzyme activating protein [Anaerolineaceae bacterium]
MNQILVKNEIAHSDIQEDALILHLQRLSTEDGPGLRTTVFFKQCMLNCTWCHNPESISREVELQWFQSRCIGCQTCLKSCPLNCLQLTDDGLQIDRESCDGCGECTRVCPTLAMEQLGNTISLEGLFEEVLKDRAYFEKSEQGGVTVSGGEPLLQADFVRHLFQRLQAEGIHTALDTCGFSSAGQLQKVIPFCDMVLFDLKEIDTDRHRAFTGQSNEVIFKNLLKVRDVILQEKPALKLWIRTPLIPGTTANRENITRIGQFLAKELSNVVERWELLAFNNLARDKYSRLGKNWQFADTPLMTKEDLEKAEEWARRSGVDPRIVFVTGAVRVEE